MEFIKRREEARCRVVREALEWAESLSMRVSVVLIGSYARGDFNLWSDVDIVLVSEDLRGGPVERLRNIEAPPGYEVIPLTPGEIMRLLEKGNVISVEAVERGVVLRDNLEIFRSLGRREREDPCLSRESLS